MMKCRIFDRLEYGRVVGQTVTKRAALPDGEFQIDEYVWPDRTIWFVQSDNFTEDEREAVYEALKEQAGAG